MQGRPWGAGNLRGIESCYRGSRSNGGAAYGFLGVRLVEGVHGEAYAHILEAAWLDGGLQVLI